ncbi:xanthine dehydrogenase YagT iron-sulfur-binding subunit [Paraburkholderia sp. GAS38]|uniref:(2Fe-2S)-binding protein n=1 Tax=Paraburkholderia sp. GAS38 TaxID=3035133 RepID=UPI003D1B8DAC
MTTALNQTPGRAASATPASDATAQTASAPVVERPLTQFRAQPLTLKVNGRDVTVQVPTGLMMIDLLHEYLDLTGSRLGCGQGVCHACVVILDKPDGTSEEVRTCITGANFFDGKSIRTIEGHAQRNGQGEVVALSPIQQKFLEHFSFQCGYCTPGFVNAATVLIERLKRQPVARDQVEETITEALNDHICRCTGYVRYYEAVKDVVMTMPGLVKDAA